MRWGGGQQKIHTRELKFSVWAHCLQGVRPKYKVPGLGFGLCVSSCGQSSEREAKYSLCVCKFRSLFCRELCAHVKIVCFDFQFAIHLSREALSEIRIIGVSFSIWVSSFAGGLEPNTHFWVFARRLGFYSRCFLGGALSGTHTFGFPPR